jgi:hypothetical protein
MKVSIRCRRRSCFRVWCLFVSLVLVLPACGLAEECFIHRECFGVKEPNMVERVCYLYAHEVNTRPESAMVVATPLLQQHPDQLHVEFLKLLVEKKFVVLKQDTRIFSCGYNLERIRKEPEDAEWQEGELPRFNCRGSDSEFVPVRPVNLGTCYWVALENVECR